LLPAGFRPLARGIKHVGLYATIRRDAPRIVVAGHAAERQAHP
jgi:hypothetical protein